MNKIDIVNYNNNSRLVYTASEMEHLPGKVAGALDATQDLMNIGMCSGGSAFLSIRIIGRISRLLEKKLPLLPMGTFSMLVGSNWNIHTVFELMLEPVVIFTMVA